MPVMSVTSSPSCQRQLRIAVHSNDDHPHPCREGHSAASVIGATYREGVVNDLEIFYEPGPSAA